MEAMEVRSSSTGDTMTVDKPDITDPALWEIFMSLGELIELRMSCGVFRTLMAIFKNILILYIVKCADKKIALSYQHKSVYQPMIVLM